MAYGNKYNVGDRAILNVAVVVTKVYSATEVEVSVVDQGEFDGSPLLDGFFCLNEFLKDPEEKS